jgi:nicotinamidase-related amidase
LLTPQNCALLVIDYQPSQIQTVASIDHDLLVRNIVSVARLALTYELPVVLSTVNVAANGQPPTVPELRGGPFGLGRDRPHPDQLLGGRRVPPGR